MKYLFLSLLLPSICYAQAFTIGQGCFLEFETGECQEAQDNFRWVDYGNLSNQAIYGFPVAALINQAREDRALLQDWIDYATRLEGRNKKLKRSLRTLHGQ